MVNMVFLILQVLLFINLNVAYGINANYKLDEDTSADCKELAKNGKCVQDDTTYFRCPISCSKEYQDTSALRTPWHMPESDFYDITGIRNADGKEVDLNRYDGYVTLLVVVPLVKGLAQFTIEMFEHIHAIYPYTLEIIILPVKVLEDSPVVTPLDDDQQKKLLKPDTKMSLWETITDAPNDHKVLKLFEKNSFIKSEGFYNDRAVCYVISADGDKVDKRVSENMIDMERIAGHYIKGIAKNSEF